MGLLFVEFLTVCCCLTSYRLISPPLSLSSLSLFFNLSLSSSLPLFLSGSIAHRDHIYTVDTETANSDEIFFSKVSEMSVTLRTCCSQCAVIDNVTLITWCVTVCYEYM